MQHWNITCHTEHPRKVCYRYICPNISLIGLVQSVHHIFLYLHHREPGMALHCIEYHSESKSVCVSMTQHHTNIIWNGKYIYIHIYILYACLWLEMGYSPTVASTLNLAVLFSEFAHNMPPFQNAESPWWMRHLKQQDKNVSWFLLIY